MSPLSNNSLLLAAIVVWSLVSPDRGWTADAPAPSAPFVTFPTERAHYVVEVKRKNPAEMTPPTPGGNKFLLKAEITMVAPIFKRTNTWNDGTVTEDWGISNWAIVQSPYGKWFNVVPAKKAKYPMNISDFGLLSLKTYEKVAEFQNQSCYLFVTGTYVAPRLNMPPQQGITAYRYLICINSRLPLAVEDGEALYIYKFSDPPEGKLVLPATYQAEWDRAHGPAAKIAP